MTTMKIHPHKSKNAEILSKVAYGAFRSVTQPTYGTSHKQLNHQDIILPAPPKTNACTWCSAWICFLTVGFLIVGSVIVLVVFFLFHPHLPRFDVEDAHLNAIRLDPNTLLFNSEMVALVTFSNTNAKVDINYDYLNFKLYFQTDVVATQVLEPFQQTKREQGMHTLDLISTDVELKALNAHIMINDATLGNRVVYNLVGTFKTKAKLGPLVRLPYWLYAHCRLTLAYPNGTLADHFCKTHN